MPPTPISDAAYTDETWGPHQWQVADIIVDLPVGEHEQVFTMRQVSLTVANNKTAYKNTLRLRRGRSTS